MNPVIIKNCAIGQDRPKIIVPLMGCDKASIHAEAVGLKNVKFDVVEWRIDWFDKVLDEESLIEAAKDLYKTLPDTPILITLRTKNEGGNLEVKKDQYKKILTSIITSGYVDMIDIELTSGDKLVESLVKLARKNKVVTVVSSHEWQDTPDSSEMLNRIKKMRTLGADIPKLAVTPTNPKDVLRLLSVTEELSSEADYPIITMAMGGLGVVSRLAGETFGSAMTFGSATKASAPGQIEANCLDGILSAIHNAC